MTPKPVTTWAVLNADNNYAINDGFGVPFTVRKLRFRIVYSEPTTNADTEPCILFLTTELVGGGTVPVLTFNRPVNKLDNNSGGTTAYTEKTGPWFGVVIPQTSGNTLYSTINLKRLVPLGGGGMTIGLPTNIAVANVMITIEFSS